MHTTFISDNVNTCRFKLLAKRQLDIFPSLSTSTAKKFQLHNRRYIGNKYKLLDWIFSIINKECKGKIFADIFSGTGVISMKAHNYFDKLIINDLLYSNCFIYRAFFEKGAWDEKKISSIIDTLNCIQVNQISDNYFSKNFGGRYFSKDNAKMIGYIRQFIENNRDVLTDKEYYILLTSLLYSIDKIANTVGHYDSYLRKEHLKNHFRMCVINPVRKPKNILIYRENANHLVKNITADIVYIDPPYNSRQYSRFYHVLETLAKWDNSKLYGVCLKPKPENISDYCKVAAINQLDDLIKNIKAKYIVVSYNNTYNSKSVSSKNKIRLEQINTSLREIGKTKVYNKEHKYFNAGNTNFKNHKEYLFVTAVGV